MKSILAACTAIAMTVGAGFASETVSVEDRFKMIDAVTAIAAGADRHQWDRVRGAFADDVTLDYTSLWGGEAATRKADDIVAQWAGFLPGFDETLHLVTNHTITGYDGTTAALQADFQAAHRIGDAQWVLSGHYDYELVRSGAAWKVRALTMTWTHETGDRGLVGTAAERAQQSK